MSAQPQTPPQAPVANTAPALNAATESGSSSPKTHGKATPDSSGPSLDDCSSVVFQEAQRTVRKHGGVRRQLVDVNLIADETHEELKKKESPCLKVANAEVIRALSIAGMLAPLEKSSLVKERAGFVMQNVIGDVIFDYPERSLKFGVWTGKKMKLHPLYLINPNDDSAGYYVPPGDRYDSIEKKIVSLPTGVGSYGTTAKLVEKMKRFIGDYYQAPGISIEIMAHYALMTWVANASTFGSVPYLRWLGEPETGKTRGMDATSALSYRPIRTNGAGSSAVLFRIMDKWQGTLVLDEADMREGTDMWDSVGKILNLGYLKNGAVLRADGKENEPRPFLVYGPKIISTRQPFDDVAVETRCITFRTKEVDVPAEIPLNVQAQFYNRAQELQNELLQWRFDNFHKIKVDEREIRKQHGNRLAQIGSALLAVVEDPAARERIIGYLSEAGVQEKQNRGAAIVLEALSRIEDVDLENQGEAECKLPGNGVVLLKHVACFANTAARDFGGLNEKQPGTGVYFSIEEIKGILRSMGFVVKRMSPGNVVHIDEAHLAKMREKYGLGAFEPSVRFKEPFPEI